jgi:hypothetical protein
MQEIVQVPGQILGGGWGTPCGDLFPAIPELFAVVPRFLATQRGQAVCDDRDGHQAREDSMTISFDLRQKDVVLSPEMTDSIRIRAEKLARHSRPIHRCTVTVEGPSPHHRQGVWAVRIDLIVQGTELIVRKPAAATLELALRSAFLAMARQLESQLQRSRGFVKSHESR